MPEYTHEVFRVNVEGQPTTYYYHQPTRCVYSLEHKLGNDDWVPDGKFWRIRPIHIDLENK